MSSNKNLQVAKDEKNDEFYTLFSDIEKELSHYHFENKIVFCPCDTMNSAFTKFFFDRYDSLKLCGLIATGLGTGIAKFKRMTVPVESLDCFSDDAFQTMCYSDIVVTNPPFSLFREFMAMIIRSKKQFLILGNLNAVKYKEIFPLIKERKVWLGYSHGTMTFVVPDNFQRNNVFEKDNVRYAKFGNICWFTNLTRTFKPLKLTKQYSVSNYKHYDNYSAIDVPKVKDIPNDYFDIMGVPITILQYHDPEQFEIVGELNHGCDNQYDFAKPVVEGKDVFPRILIRRKQVVL